MTTGATWGDVFTTLTDRSHLVVGEGLSAMIDEAVRPLGLHADVLLVDLGQRVLTSVRMDPPTPQSVEGTLAGRAFQYGEFVAGFSDDGLRMLWVPMLDGTERAGVVSLELGPEVVDDLEFRRRCWTLSGLMGHIAIAKLPYSDRIRRLRAPRPLTVAAELLWQLVPPRTFATDNVCVTALLEPYDRVAGDGYDYVVDLETAYVAVFDGVGHDLAAGSATALAVSAIRNARRRGVTDLAALAVEADVQMQAPGRSPGSSPRSWPGWTCAPASCATSSPATPTLSCCVTGTSSPRSRRPRGRRWGSASTPRRWRRPWSGSSPATAWCSTPTASPRRAAPTDGSSASAGWPTSANARSSTRSRRPRRCDGSPPRSSSTRAGCCRTTPPC